MDSGVIDLESAPDGDFESAPDGATSVKERRLVHRFQYYWLRLRRNQGLPSIDDLNIAALPAPWTQCYLLTRTDAAEADEFDHLGEAFQADQTPANGNRIAAVRPESLLDYATRSIPLVVADLVPIIFSGSIVTTNRRHVRFRSIILPFAGRASGNLYLLGSASWREDVLSSPEDMEELACCKFDEGDWRPVNPATG